MSTLPARVTALPANPLIDVLRKAFRDLADGRASPEADSLELGLPGLAADRAEARRIAEHAPSSRMATVPTLAPTSAPSPGPALVRPQSSGPALDRVVYKYRLTLVSHQCLVETDDGIGSDEIYGHYTVFARGYEPTAGKVPLREAIDAGERNTFRRVMYEGPAESLAFGVRLLEDDRGSIDEWLADAAATVARLWHAYVEPYLEIGDDEVVAFIGDALDWLAAAVRHAVYDVVGTARRSFSVRDLDLIPIDTPYEWAQDVSGDGGRYRVTLRLANLGPHRVDLPDQGRGGPALGTVGDQLVVAWRGIGERMELGLRSGTVPQHLGATVVTPFASRMARIAVAGLGRKLVMAWLSDSGTRGVLVATSTDGGRSFGTPTQVASVVQNAGIALCVHRDRLYLSWAGRLAGNEVQWNVALASSSDGVHWSEPAHLRTLAFDTELASFGGRLYLLHREVDGSNRLRVTSSSDGHSFDRRCNFAEPSSEAAGLAAFDDKLYVAWKTKAHGRLAVASSSDGVNFGTPVYPDELPGRGVALCAHGDHLYAGWSQPGDVPTLHLLTVA